MSIALYLCRFGDLAIDRYCKLEDTSYRYSSKILQSAKDCYWNPGYYNNSGTNPDSLVFPIDSVLLVGLVYW